MVFNDNLVCPDCNGILVVIRYADDRFRFEGHCIECDKIYDIRLEEEGWLG